MSASSLVSFLSTFHCSGCCSHSSCFLAVIRSFRQGILYGAKVRLPHAAVMTFLFRTGSLREKVQDILNMTYQHARNLGCYAAIYKFFSCFLRHVRQREDSLNAIIPGALGGALMFGSNSPVNSQINMYVMSRVIFGLAHLAVEKGAVPAFNGAFTLFAAVTWALVMYLFEKHPATLQKSLTNSMTYLYHDSDHWPAKAENLLQWIIQ